MDRPTKTIEALPSKAQAGVLMLELLAIATGYGLPAPAERKRLRAAKASLQPKGGDATASTRA